MGQVSVDNTVDFPREQGKGTQDIYIGTVAVQVYTRYRTRMTNTVQVPSNYRYNDGQQFSEDWYVFGNRQVIYRNCRL